MKTLLALINCHSRASHADAQRATWIPTIPTGLDYKFFLGPSDRAPGPDEVFLNCDDSYRGLPNKVQEVIRWSRSNGYEYMVKIDDDVVVKPSSFLASGFQNHDFVGHSNDDQGGPRTPWGFFYALSRRSMDIMANAPLPPNNNDELWIAYTLARNGIGLHHEPRLYLQKQRIMPPKKRPLRAPPRPTTYYLNPAPGTFAWCVYISGCSPEKLQEYMKIWEREQCQQEKLQTTQP